MQRGSWAGRAAVATGVLLLASGCRPSTVRLAFIPVVGTVYRYAIDVMTTTTTQLSGEPARTVTDTAELLATDTVLGFTITGTQLRVEISEHGTPRGTFDVLLDRQAALLDIEPAAGSSANTLSDVEVEHLVPAALGAPPDRPLQVNDRWHIDQPVQFPHALPTRLIGSGRLSALGILHGRRVAITQSSGTISLVPSASAAGSSQGASAGTPSTPEVGLQGTETTQATLTRALEDGSVEATTATTHGVFAVTVQTLEGGSSPLIGGTLTMDVRSSTRRLN